MVEAVAGEVEEGEIRGEVNQAPAAHSKEGNKAKHKAKIQATLQGLNGGFVNVYGPNACASISITTTNAIWQADVQGLLLWLLGDGQAPRWVFLKNKPYINKVVVLSLPGLDAHTFLEKQEQLPGFGLLGSPIATRATVPTLRPGQAVGQFFSAPLTKKRKRELSTPEQEGGKKRHHPLPPEHYRITLDQMEANFYPLPHVLDNLDVVPPEGYVATQPRVAGDEASKSYTMVAMDCEMCKTEAGDELTRVSLVAENGEVLLDELVVPDLPITDYVTPYSGITAEMLAGVNTRLADVQRRFLELVDAETLLVGHALDNDLRAMRVIHANIVDTALLFPHPRGPPFKPKLKLLASQFLKRNIQAGSHDSVDDARAALDLAQLKFKHGPLFGHKEEQREHILDIFAQKQHRCAVVDRKDFMDRNLTGSASAYLCGSDQEVADKAAREAAKPGTNFLWAGLRGLVHVQEQRAARRRRETLGDPPVFSPPPTSKPLPSTPLSGSHPAVARAAEQRRCVAESTEAVAEGTPPQPRDALSVPPMSEDERAQEDAALQMYDQAVSAIWREMPPNALLLVMTCIGDTAEVRRQKEMRYKRMARLIQPPWEPRAQEEQCRLEARHSCGLTFCAVKPPPPPAAPGQS